MIQSDIVSLYRFDKKSDISTTYLGKVESKRSQDKLKAEESFPISESVYTLGRLLDGVKCQMVPVNTLCQGHFICSVNLYIHYQNLPPPHKEYRLEMIDV